MSGKTIHRDQEIKLKSKSKRGRKSLETYANEFCRLCRKCLRIIYGDHASFKSYSNIFKPTRDSCKVLADSLRSIGIEVYDSENISQVVCGPCGRKLRSLCETFKSVLNSLHVDSSKDADNAKRKMCDVVTPDRSSPANRKSRRQISPSSKSQAGISRRKALFPFSNNENEPATQATLAHEEPPQAQAIETVMLSKLNIDNLDTTRNSAMKVLIAYPSGNITVKENFDEAEKSVISNICLSKWSRAVNAIFRHQSLYDELLKYLELKADLEFTHYTKTESCLKFTSPDQLAVFSNKVLCQEISVYCPLYYSIVRGASARFNDENSSDQKATNAIALATSALARVKQPCMSALAYRISTILFHSGVSHRDHTRLNHLGICMSPKMVISLHEKMGKDFDHKVQLWKKEIEINKSAQSLLHNIMDTQLPKRSDDDMDIIIEVKLDEDSTKDLPSYNQQNYEHTLSLCEGMRKSMGEECYTDEVLQQVEAKLRQKKLPTYKIVADNIDHEISARVQTKETTNRSIHWTHQYALKDKVSDPTLDTAQPKKNVKDLQLVDLLPDQVVQENLIWQWAVLISRILTKYIPALKDFKNSVMHHIPHIYSKEMSSKSNVCSLGMQFYNPNVASQMAEILKNYQENYVPIATYNNKKQILGHVPVHGDQLFEERARNVQNTFRHGQTNYDRLEGLLPEHADWHAKVTLYKVEFETFVGDSAQELGTSRASMNRCGKTNAAKGVHNHYNEYKDFHDREMEAHICAAFMNMSQMASLEDTPILDHETPNSNADTETKGKWLIAICKELVMKYAIHPELSNLVEQTAELDRATQNEFRCRFETCNKTYVLHSRRVRHEVMEHELQVEVFTGDDERDTFGYYFCQFVGCGLVFTGKQTRIRHERQFHPNFNAAETHLEKEISKPEDKKEDFIFNYHQGKIMLGLIIMTFEDAVKEGDGERLFQLYKILLLIYKAHGHTKYAYVTLLYLVKICALLPEFEANRLKWNRFYNTHGEKGKNIPLDLRKEHQNRQLKTMWKALGPNLNEESAARVAGTLDHVECILESIDKDCNIKDTSGSHRSVSNKDEAVQDIVQDLVTKNVFRHTPGRVGHPSFPNFSSNILSDLDYRDLHQWMKGLINKWESIYQDLN